MPKKKRFTVEAGRQVYFDGQPFISIGREGATDPSTADRMTHFVAKCMNRNPKLLRELKRVMHTHGGESVRLPLDWKD